MLDFVPWSHTFLVYFLFYYLGLRERDDLNSLSFE